MFINVLNITDASASTELTNFYKNLFEYLDSE